MTSLSQDGYIADFDDFSSFIFSFRKISETVQTGLNSLRSPELVCQILLLGSYDRRK